MKFLNFDEVLCIGAHPDDVEYSLLSSILKFQDTLFHVLCLSAGGDYDRTTSVERIKECSSIWKKVNNISGYTQPFAKFVKDMQDDRVINFIENTYSKFDCVFTPPLQDSHFEHRKVSGLGPALARKRLMGVITYRTPGTLDEWTPNLYIDVSAEIDRKINLLEHFKSQAAHSYLQEDSIRYFHSNYQCLKRGIKYVEAFRIESLYQ